MAKVRVEIYVAVNENGDYYIATDADDAASGLKGDYGSNQCQITCIIAKIAIPNAAEIHIDVPDPAKAAGTLVEVDVR